jgi:hypothetical protein
VAAEGDAKLRVVPGLRLEPPPARPGRVRVLGALPWFVLAAVGAGLLTTSRGSTWG